MYNRILQGYKDALGHEFASFDGCFAEVSYTKGPSLLPLDGN